jgi:hypothetical protein
VRYEIQMKLEHIKVEHIWAVVFFTVGLLMLATSP